MAGAGYKLFNTGDVLTAAQVNTYLMEQTVMVFANAAARTTALSGVVSEGMISYLKDTNAVEVYDGSNWVSSDDPNAIQNTIVDAKGDLIAATANDTPARLAVGNNGETLVADSSTSTGLRWGNNYGFTAGKNKILNADFRLNQRAFTSSTTTATYGFDRWRFTCDGGTVTYSAQTFTAGAAPVAGYEAINYARLVTSGQSAASDRALLNQLIEDVRTCAGQTVTVSFWAQAGSGTPKVNVVLNQNFGTGGSASVNAPIPTAQTISTSWARYSFTIDVPSVSGKTISATDSRLNVQLYVSDGGNQSTGVGAQNNTFNIWGVQVETGSVATAFQTATGTLGMELAAAMRYYQKSYEQGTAPATATNNGRVIAQGGTVVSNGLVGGVVLPVVMRGTPTVTIYTANGTSGRVDNLGGTDQAAGSGTAFVPTQTGFGVQNQSGGSISTSFNGFGFHYTASAEL